MSSFNVSTADGIAHFDKYIASRMFVHGGIATQADVQVFSQLARAPPAQFAHAQRHYHTMQSFTDMELNRLPGVQGEEQQAAAAGEDIAKLVEEQANKVRDLKAQGVSKADLKPEIDRLLELKQKLSATTTAAAAATPTTTATTEQPKQKQQQQPQQAAEEPNNDGDDGSKSKNQLKKEAKLKKTADKKAGKQSSEHETSSVSMSTKTKETYTWNHNETLMENMKSLFGRAIALAFPAASLPDIRVARRNNSIQVNSALDLNQMAGTVEGIPKSGPAEIGKQVVAYLPHNSIVTSVGVTPNGFIVAELSMDIVVQGHVASIVREGVQPPPPKPEINKSTTVAVDFSSPNIAKQMHVGHLRSTIIGDTICKLFEFCGYDVRRINHTGDWGTQFGMLLCHLEDNFPDFAKSENLDIGDLTNFYKQSKARFDSEDGFKKRAQEKVVTLQSGDKHARAMWQFLCDVSRRQFDQVYNRLGIRIHETGESFYNSRIPSVISLLEKQKLVEVSDGALCVFVNRDTLPPLMVRKKDGGYGYDATDITAIHYRIHELKSEILIYITDVGQAEHFKLVFETAKMAGWTGNRRVEHIGFGLVLDENGHKFKTRSGDTVPLIGLLDEACTRMEDTLNSRIEAGKCPLQKGDEVKHAANVIGHASVKYYDLRQNPSSNYIFSYDKMLDDKGDTAVYLLYTRARINSILRKAEAEHNVNLKELVSNASQLIRLTDPTEQSLGFELMQFGDIVKMAMRDLQPNILCKYLYDVSVAYSKWNNKCKVLGSPEMHSRLLLSFATLQVMDTCFSLLGIPPLDKI